MRLINYLRTRITKKQTYSTLINSFRLITTSYSFSWTIVASSINISFSLHINNFVIISTIINFIMVGSAGPWAVPAEINRPGAWSPLSHFIVIFNWCVWFFWISHPVHDKVIISGIVNTKRPWFSPAVVDTISALIITLGLDESNTWVWSSWKSNSLCSSDKSKNKLHI